MNQLNAPNSPVSDPYSVMSDPGVCDAEKSLRSLKINK